MGARSRSGVMRGSAEWRGNISLPLAVPHGSPGPQCLRVCPAQNGFADHFQGSILHVAPTHKLPHHKPPCHSFIQKATSISNFLVNGSQATYCMRPWLN